MTSKIKYPTIWRPLIYSRLSTALHNCAYCDIYEWNSVSSTPFASYDITTEKQWRQKSSNPLFDALWFIQVLSTALHNCAYCDIYEWNRCLQHTTCKLWHHNREAMTSKIKYPTIWRPLIYVGTLNCIAQLCCICVTYTSEIMSAAHHLQAMTSQKRSNDVENQVSHYLTPSDLFGTLNCIAQLCILWHIRVK